MTLTNKLKQAVISQYTYGRSKDTLTDRDLKRMERALRWRKRVLDNLLLLVGGEAMEPDEMIDLIGSLPVHRQIESDVDIYQSGIETLAVALGDEEIDEETFTDRLVVLTLAILILALLLGSTVPGQPFTLEQQLLFDAATTIINADFTSPNFDQSEYNMAQAILESAEFINDGLTTRQQEILQENMQIANESAAGFGEAISAGTYAGIGGLALLLARIVLWVGTALMIFNFAKLLRPDNPFLVWLYNPIKQHCKDCLRLHNQVHTAQEWDNSGWVPRGRMLECEGYRCGCGLYESDGPSQGNF